MTHTRLNGSTCGGSPTQWLDGFPINFVNNEDLVRVPGIPASLAPDLIRWREIAGNIDPEFFCYAFDVSESDISRINFTLNPSFVASFVPASSTTSHRPASRATSCEPASSATLSCTDMNYGPRQPYRARRDPPQYPDDFYESSSF